MKMKNECVRCGDKQPLAVMMSRFNEDICCTECIKKEREHPEYKRAQEAELEACKRGDFNFAGIGKPEDL